MITINEIQRRYFNGYITSTDAVFMILRTIVDEDSHSLDEVGNEVVPFLVEYLREYDPKHGTIGGEPPTERQVQVAKKWLARELAQEL